jgi:UDP-N-acetylmuramyl-tripeptide synthetase
MQQAKLFVKKLLPSQVRQPLINVYHWLVAVAANIRYGFPARAARVIMVTGTNGKTTTAAFIAEMLASAGHKVGAITTAYYMFGTNQKEVNASNRTIDDIFKLQAMLARMKQAGCEYVVMEATSQALDQHRLWGIPCDVAVMTNLTQDHLDYHGTMERYAKAKGKLFARRPNLVVLNRDDQWFDFFNQFEAGERKVTYGTQDGATCQIIEAELHKDGSDVTLKIENEHQLKFHIGLPGRFNVYNATAATTVGYYLMLEPQQIIDGISSLTTVPGRLERVDGGQRFDVFVDYAHTPDALQNLLDTLKHLTKGRLWLVFGATGNRDKTKRPIMGKIAAELADKIILTDEEPYDEDPAVIRQEVRAGVVEAGAEAKLQEVGDRRQAIAAAVKGARPGDVVVITGMGHEQFRVVGGERLPWSDVDVAREALEGKRR